MCLKGLIAAAFEISEPLHLLGLNGRVGAILRRESTDSLIYISSTHLGKCTAILFSTQEMPKPLGCRCTKISACVVGSYIVPTTSQCFTSTCSYYI